MVDSRQNKKDRDRGHKEEQEQNTQSEDTEYSDKNEQKLVKV